MSDKFKEGIKFGWLYDGLYIIPISKNECPISEATNENERAHEEFQSMVQAMPLQDRCMENPLVLVGVIKNFGRCKRYVMSFEQLRIVERLLN